MDLPDAWVRMREGLTQERVYKGASKSYNCPRENDEAYAAIEEHHCEKQHG